jgi:hypothetical protein
VLERYVSLLDTLVTECEARGALYWRNQLSYNGVVGKRRGAANAGELCHGLFEHGT